MMRRPLPWYHRARFHVVHGLTLPLLRLFNRFPHYEVGLQSFEVTRLVCAHPPLAGRRAVQISDLHLDRYRPRHDLAVDVIARLEPDWIFVTGDLLNVPEGLPHLFRFLAALRSLAPVYLTLGNHDHFSGVPVDRFLEVADRHKVCLLINQTVFVPLPSGELSIAGLDDPSLHRADLRCLPARASGRYTVVLAHAPNVVDHFDDAHAADLILCGHSHGGQWRLPGLQRLWLPYGCSGRTAGYYLHKGRQLYVNRGLGWSVLPARLRCPPEILAIDWTDGGGG